jgi:hypothetical protein
MRIFAIAFLLIVIVLSANTADIILLKKYPTGDAVCLIEFNQIVIVNDYSLIEYEVVFENGRSVWVHDKLLSSAINCRK